MSRAIGAGVAAAAVVAAVGAVIALGSIEVYPRPGASRHLWPQALGFGVTAGAAAAALVYAWGDRRRRSATVGFLIGLLVACLVEGTCFFNP